MSAMASPVRYTKPSAAWRRGYLLYEGWPAQENGTDSHFHEQRKSYDLRQPCAPGIVSVVRDDVAPSVWTERYPVWWTDDSRETDDTRGPAPVNALVQREDAGPAQPAVPPTSSCTWDLPVPRPVTLCTPPERGCTEEESESRTTSSRPTDSQGDSEIQLCNQQTQTPRNRSKGCQPMLRMACNRKASTRRPPAESRVAAAHRNDEALRKQMTKARNRRLHALHNGASWWDAPIVFCSSDGAPVPLDLQTSSARGKLRVHHTEPQIAPLEIAERFLSGNHADSFFPGGQVTRNSSDREVDGSLSTSSLQSWGSESVEDGNRWVEGWLASTRAPRYPPRWAQCPAPKRASTKPLSHDAFQGISNRFGLGETDLRRSSCRSDSRNGECCLRASRSLERSGHGMVDKVSETDSQMRASSLDLETKWPRRAPLSRWSNTCDQRGEIIRNHSANAYASRSNFRRSVDGKISEWEISKDGGSEEQLLGTLDWNNEQSELRRTPRKLELAEMNLDDALSGF